MILLHVINNLLMTVKTWFFVRVLSCTWQWIIACIYQSTKPPHPFLPFPLWSRLSLSVCPFGIPGTTELIFLLLECFELWLHRVVDLFLPPFSPTPFLSNSVFESKLTVMVFAMLSVFVVVSVYSSVPAQSVDNSVLQPDPVDLEIVQYRRCG
jgi:hypothetical protein